MPDLTYTPWSFHPTLAISWLLMPQKLGNAEAQIIFCDNLTLFLAKSSQWREVVPWESLIYSLLTADLFSFSFQKVSIHRNEQNGQEYNKSHKDKLCQPRSVHGVSVMGIVCEYLTIFTVNYLACGRSSSAIENLAIIDNFFHIPSY